MNGEAPATKICPDCAETVKAQAHVCRFCGYRFEPLPRATAAARPAAAQSPAPRPMPRRGTPEWERELAATPAPWRWFLDAPGSPAIPMFLFAAVALGYGGLWPHMSGRQRAGTAFAGWAFLGGFGALVVWLAWLFVRIAVLLAAICLGALWSVYAGLFYVWRQRS